VIAATLVGKVILAALTVLGVAKGVQVYRRMHGHTVSEPLED